jgi:hypothetical protein
MQRHRNSRRRSRSRPLAHPSPLLRPNPNHRNLRLAHRRSGVDRTRGGADWSGDGDASFEVVDFCYVVDLFGWDGVADFVRLPLALSLLLPSLCDFTDYAWS